jgi:hypothetical protein
MNSGTLPFILHAQARLVERGATVEEVICNGTWGSGLAKASFDRTPDFVAAFPSTQNGEEICDQANWARSQLKLNRKVWLVITVIVKFF